MKGVLEKKYVQEEECNITLTSTEAIARMLSIDEKKKEEERCEYQGGLKNWKLIIINY